MSSYAQNGSNRRSRAAASHNKTTNRRRKTRKYDTRPARSYRNSAAKTQNNPSSRRNRHTSMYSNKPKSKNHHNRDQKMGNTPPHPKDNDSSLKYTSKGAEFYRMMRNKLYEMLGGKVCSGCGFRDERALGIALKHAGTDYMDNSTGVKYDSFGDSSYDAAHFDSICRGGAIASNWSRYRSDPKLAVSELVVLCLNCNRIREPTQRSVNEKSFARKPKQFKRSKSFPR